MIWLQKILKPFLGRYNYLKSKNLILANLLFWTFCREIIYGVSHF
jgi:hypothetical protein